jgi:hypothetical protein
MSAPSILTPPVAGQVLYRLNYKQGNNYNLWHLFWGNADKYTAIGDARAFCKLKGWIFLQVENAFVDFKAEEKAMAQE